MNTLTPRDRVILRHLWKHPRDGVEKLEAAAGIAKSTTWYHLDRLNHSGHIQPGPCGTSCTRTLTAKGLLAAQGFTLLYIVGNNGELRLAP